MTRARSTALAAGLCLLAAGCGSAPPPPPTAFDHDAATVRLRAARALLDVSERTVGYHLALLGPRPGLEGRTDARVRRITLFVGGHEPAHRLAHDLAHELGHAVDLERLSAADRSAYLARRGRPHARWWPSGASDYASGAGDFAEVYALCHAASPVFRSTLAPRPPDACAMLPGAARRAAGAEGAAR